jgi:hypothetical protein
LLNRIQRGNFNNPQVPIQKLNGPPQDLDMADDEWPRGMVYAFVDPRTGDHFRPDAGRITHRDSENGIDNCGQETAKAGGAATLIDEYSGKF